MEELQKIGRELNAFLLLAGYDKEIMTPSPRKIIPYREKKNKRDRVYTYFSTKKIQPKLGENPNDKGKRNKIKDESPSSIEKMTTEGGQGLKDSKCKERDKHK